MDVKPRNANPRDLQPELELKLKYICTEDTNTTKSRIQSEYFKNIFYLLFDYVQFTYGNLLKSRRNCKEEQLQYILVNGQIL